MLTLIEPKGPVLKKDKKKLYISFYIKKIIITFAKQSIVEGVIDYNIYPNSMTM